MTHELRFENGKAGSLDPIPLNSFSLFNFSKSYWYKMDHFQHLHLQSVLCSVEFYEYFIEQNLTAGLGPRSSGKEGGPRRCRPNVCRGLGDPPVSTLQRTTFSSSKKFIFLPMWWKNHDICFDPHCPRHCSGYEAYLNVASWSFLIE